MVSCGQVALSVCLLVLRGVSASASLRAVREHARDKPLNWRGFVINLERQPDRLRNFWYDARDYPWFRESFCRFRALDGHDHAVLESIESKDHILEEFSQMAQSGEDEHFTVGAVALYESHLRVLRMIAADPTIDFGVVAEDDLALYSKDFQMQFDKLINNASFWKDTDFVYLQACNQGWNRSSCYEPYGEHVLPRDESETTHFVDVFGTKVYCTALYAVSREGAKKLSAEKGPLLPIEKPLDWVFTKAEGIRIKAFHPSIAQAWGAQDINGSSNIQNVEMQPILLATDPSPIPDCAEVE